MREILWPAEDLLVSQEGSWSIQWVSELVSCQRSPSIILLPFILKDTICSNVYNSYNFVRIWVRILTRSIWVQTFTRSWQIKFSTLLMQKSTFGHDPCSVSFAAILTIAPLESIWMLSHHLTFPPTRPFSNRLHHQNIWLRIGTGGGLLWMR